MDKQLFSTIKKTLCAAAMIGMAHIGVAQTGYFGTYFVDTVTAANTSSGSNYTTIINTATSGNPSALVFATHNWTNGNSIYNNSATGIWYTGGDWSVYDENQYDTMAFGSAFNVVVPTTNGTAFQFINAQSSGSHISSPMSNAAINNNPGAILFVEHNYGTIGSPSAQYDTSVVGVWYDGGSWYVYNEKTYTAMPQDVTFNVFAADTTGGAAFQLTVSGSNISGDGAYISSPLTDGNPNAVIIVTHSYNGGLYDTVPVGVYYHGSQWLIYHEDRSSMAVGQTYNILVASAAVTTGISTIAADAMKFKAYPNPASDQMNISYTLGSASDVSLTLYATDGRNLGTIYQGHEGAGSYSLQHDVSALDAGSYYLVLSTADSRATYPVAVVR